MHPSYPHTKDHRSSKYEDTAPSTSCSRSQEELERQKRREKWRRQQELEMEYERKKKEKIREYENRRRQALSIRSSSESPPHPGISSQSPYLSNFKEKSIGEKPFFKGPEGRPISSKELRRIKVEIRRKKNSAKGPVPEIKRDIHNPDYVIITRRDGEGSKPIFDRPEIKQVKDSEEKEYCTVMTIKVHSDSTNKARTSRERSPLPSPSGIRYRYRSPSRSYSRTDRSEKHKVYKDNSNCIKTNVDEEDKRRTDRSRSIERRRDSHSRSVIEIRDRDRNRDCDRDRYIEQRDVVAESYIAPPPPLYSHLHPYSFPRPIIPMIGPLQRGFGQVPPIGRIQYPLPEPGRPYPRPTML